MTWKATAHTIATGLAPPVEHFHRPDAGAQGATYFKATPPLAQGDGGGVKAGTDSCPTHDVTHTSRSLQLTE